jgi:hypothetical protein
MPNDLNTTGTLAPAKCPLFYSALFFVASVVAMNCANTVGPSAANRLEISGQSPALKVGEARTLTAVLVDGTTRRSVQVTWTIDSSSAAQVVAAGTVRGVAPGVAVVHATFESYSSSVDLQVVNDYAGDWTGTYRVTACERFSGPGSSYCRFILNQVLPLDLTLSQNGASVSGSTRFYSTGGRLLLSGFFTGTSGTGGELQLAGTITAIDPSDQPETTTIDGWRSNITSSGDMTGQFIKHLQFTNAFGPQVSREDCTLLKTQRKSFAPQ